MYKRKRDINAIDLLREINDYKRRNKTNIYNTKTLNINERNRNREYNTKTMKSYITSYNDYDSMNKEIKKKKNKGKLDLGSHRNKDIFFEVDSEQYDSGNNSKKSNNNKKNKCSKLLIDKITPYTSEHYLTQSNINPYYSIKTYNNYNIKKPFNSSNKKNNIKNKKKNEIIQNNKINNNKKSNNLSSFSSNEIIKYPLVIQLKSKDNIHAPQISNLSNYLNEEVNDYFISLSDNANITEEKNENNYDNKEEENYRNYAYKEQDKKRIPFDRVNDINEPDYKMLYLMKEKEYNKLMNDYNNIKYELNKKENNNYIIHNFKKLNRNKINNNIIKRNNIDYNNKSFDKNKLDKNIEPIHNINIFYERKQKHNTIYELNKESFNIISEKNSNTIPQNFKIFNEIKFEIIKSCNQNISLNYKSFNNHYLIINKENNIKLLSNNKKLKSKINNEYILSKFNINITPEIKEVLPLKNCNIISFNLEGNLKDFDGNKKNSKEKTYENKSNSISIDLKDILSEINPNNKLKNNKYNKNNNDEIKLTKIRNKKLNLNKFISLYKNKNNSKVGNHNINNEKKEEIINNDEERISNESKENNKNEDKKIFYNNILEINNYPIEKNNLNNGKIMDFPDLSYIRNKLNISIIKRKKINEEELKSF